MGEIKWTDSQEAAIKASGKNVLVSAAAGSGKTAVLTERVIRMLKRENDPADLDSMVIMTFTRAAAEQMKTKIAKGIYEAIKADPGNEHLKRQLHKVDNARISTIDALCSDIVRQNFHAVDIDPGYRIPDEPELIMLRNDVLAQLIEDKYAEGSDEFLDFVSLYIDKNDARLDEIILTLFNFAQSHPEPEEWIRESAAPYACAAGYCAGDSRGELKWAEAMKDVVDREIEGIRLQARNGLRLSRANYGPYKYEPYFQEILDFIDKFTKDDCIYNVRSELLESFLGSWQQSPRKNKNDDVDAGLNEAAKNLRSEIKDRLRKLEENFFSATLDERYADMAECAGTARVITNLTLEFMERFRLAKKERDFADFSDLAHLALEILIEKNEDGSLKKDEDGNYIYTETADSMAGEITEIIVDEYQDTNQLQECIINALSAERFGRPDVFMVGDVKQSIYGFRMACPQLFTQKYSSYSRGDASGQRILLNTNFRSRKSTLDFANFIFNQAMTSSVGEIDYTDGHGLEYGEGYKSPEDESAYIPEIMFIEEGGKDGKIAEGALIAHKINSLVGNFDVCDPETGSLRKACYGDIAVLTRNRDNPELEGCLKDAAVPVIKSSGRGFFDTFEIRLMIDLLKVIDNPYQDIPFAAVLASPLADVDANELAKIRISSRVKPFSLYRAARSYKEKTENLKAFLDRLEDYRKRSVYMGVYELMEYVIRKNNIEEMLVAMPAGEGRCANLEMLKNMALAFARNQYSGLFSFVRYIADLQDAELDFGQAPVSGSEDAVHMMTIHGSKGLEFPIVFLAGAGRAYRTDNHSLAICLDRNLGLGLEKRDPVERTVKSTLVMETILESKKREQYAEEMRLLYVAMTRAKEKLYITGTSDSLDKPISIWCRKLYDDEMQLGGSEIMSAGSFLKLLGMCMVRHEDGAAIYSRGGYGQINLKAADYKNCHFKADILKLEQIEEDRLEEILDSESKKAEIMCIVSEKEAQRGDCPDQSGNITPCEGKPAAAEDKDDRNRYRDIFNRRYRYEADTLTPVKITASSLEKKDEDPRNFWKNAAAALDTEEAANGLRGAERGNAYHRFFELIDYAAIEECISASRQAAPSADSEASHITDDEVKNRLETLFKGMIADMELKGLISHEYGETISPAKAAAFALSSIGSRMRSAALKGTLRREQQFVMRWGQQLLQGIIDAFFIEDGKAVLVDYKTDTGREPGEIAQMYRGQQEAYAGAIRGAFGVEVSEKILYSVEYDSEILL